ADTKAFSMQMTPKPAELWLRSPESWNESQVSTWLRSIGVKEQYINKIYEEEVDGRILLTLDENFLKTKICMKLGPAHLIIQERDQLKNSPKHPHNQRKVKWNYTLWCGGP
uniref:SAM domain-containing protein n=1 Tax=Takifugu rubripes TaxID=31033 RepID=A0A674NIC3_TAKRU